MLIEFSLLKYDHHFSFQTGISGGKLSCHNGWIPYAPTGSTKYTYCLKILTVFRMTWQQAEESCRQVGKDAHLVSIQTIEQIGWLTEAV